MVRRQHSARHARLEDLAELSTPETETPGPEEGGWRSLRRDRLINALGRLSSVQREVLVLSYIGGYSYSEIAAATEVPLGTVKTRAHAAVRRLSAQLSDIAE